ncbi:hypothetical protein Ctob_012718, partial [Chrysochromulina tobinii]
MDFVNKPLLTGELDEVPGLGEVGINTLNRSGIFTTYQVIGKFLEFGRDPERLHTWLVDMGCHKSSMTTHQTAHKIADRVLIKGFKCEIKLSDHVLTSSQSRFGDDQKRAFMNQKLTGNLGDFTGIGSASLANLAAVGITNSDGLFAAFLSIIDNPNPMANTDKCDQFYEQLGRWKVASGFKATIIYQLQSKLAVGIDSSNPPPPMAMAQPVKRIADRRARRVTASASTNDPRNICQMDFVNKPLLTGELDEVPGLGEVGINTLNRSGIFTTYQVIGKYLEIARRVLIKGFKCEIKLSDGVIKSSHSHFGDDKKRAFMNKKLTGNLTVDFTGIKEVTVANLAA